MEEQQKPASTLEPNNKTVSRDAGDEMSDAKPIPPVALGEKLEDASSNAATTTRPQIVFDAKLGKDNTRGSTGANRKRLVRYQTNPRANWGPMNRAKGGQKD